MQNQEHITRKEDCIFLSKELTKTLYFLLQSCTTHFNMEATTMEIPETGDKMFILSEIALFLASFPVKLKQDEISISLEEALKISFWLSTRAAHCAENFSYKSSENFISKSQFHILEVTSCPIMRELGFERAKYLDYFSLDTFNKVRVHVYSEGTQYLQLRIASLLQEFALL